MKPIETDDGLFHNGNLSTNALGTPVTASWLNSVQGEIVSTIREAGLEPSAAVQLPEAIKLLARLQARSAPLVTLSTDTALDRDDDWSTVRFTGQSTSTVTLPLLTAEDAGWRCTLINAQDNPYVGLWIGGLVRVGLAARESLTVQWNGTAWLRLDWLRHAQPGQTSMWEGPVVPFGWALRDATAIAVADYPALLAALYCGDANNATAATGYRYDNQADPAGSRSTAGAYLHLTDMRGEFERALDAGRGVDADRAQGSGQAGALESHTHGFPVRNSHPQGGPSGPDPASSNLDIQIGDYRTTATGGAETRPRNVAHFAIRRMI